MTSKLLRRTAGTAAAVSAIAATTGCVGVGVANATLEFNDTETAKITEVQIGEGAGDVLIRTGERPDTSIKRSVRYSGEQPTVTYRLDGSILKIDTDCGMTCSVSYVIDAPTGLTVRGGTTSGNIQLEDVAATDVKATSGDITLRRTAGPLTARTTSGNIAASEVKGAVTVETTSGDIQATQVTGGAVKAVSTSGNIEVDLTNANAIAANATSGDVIVTVPKDRYKVSVDANSGDTDVNVPNDATATHELKVQTTSGSVSIREL
jgi:hypothetical protein